jgi:hypothetical protein
LHNRFDRRPQRAAASGRFLSAEDAGIVKGMLARGDRQHDVAGFFGVNAGRIAEISNGAKFRDVQAADPSHLPEPGIFLSLPDRAAIAGAIWDAAQLRDGLKALARRLELLLKTQQG